VRLRAPPHSVWQRKTGARYTAGADSFIRAAPEHAEALLKAGCARAEPVK